MQEGEIRELGDAWGAIRNTEGKVSCIVDERCRTRVCEKHFIDPALYLFLLLLVFSSPRKTNNKRKQSEKVSAHTQRTRFPPWIFLYFRQSISSLSLAFSSSVQETTRILASSCVSFLFSFRGSRAVGVPYLFLYAHTEETELTKRKLLALDLLEYVRIQLVLKRPRIFIAHPTNRVRNFGLAQQIVSSPLPKRL